MWKNILKAWFLSSLVISAAGAAPIAEYVVYEGFSPDPKEVRIGIDVTGIVTALELRAGGTLPSVITLGRVEGADLSQLIMDINAITDEELVDRNAGEPECMDAPMTISRIYRNGSTQTMDIRIRQACHDFFLLSWTNGPLADKVNAVLDSFVKIYYEQAR